MVFTRALADSIKILSLTALLTIGALTMGQDCNAILEHGIFDRTTTDSLRIKTQTLINWLSQSTFKSFAEARDAGLKIGFPIDNLPVELNGYSRDSEWSQYQSVLQTLDLSDTRILEKFNQTVLAADQAIVNAWQVCILNKPGTAHAVIEQNYDPKAFTILLVYYAVGDQYEAKISDFSFAPSSVVCTPTMFPHFYSHEYIPSGGRILNCTRQSPSDAIQVTANTAKGPVSAKLPGMVIGKVLPRKPEWHAEDSNGNPYQEFWTMDPACKQASRQSPQHRCEFRQTQIHEPGDNTPYDMWNLYMDAPGPVYEVGCTPTGEHEIKYRGVSQGNTGLCSGEINGGDADIRMYVKWKQLW